MRLRPEQREYLRITEAVADAIEDRDGPLDGTVCSNLNINGNAGQFEAEINGVIYDVTIIEHGELLRGFKTCPKCKGRGALSVHDKIANQILLTTCPRCKGKAVVPRAKW